MDYRDIPLYPYEADPFGIMAMRRRAIAAAQERAAIEAEAAKSAAAAAQEQEPEPDPDPEPEKPAEPPPPEPQDGEDREDGDQDEGGSKETGDKDAYDLQSWLAEHRDAVKALVAARLPPVASLPPEPKPEPDPPAPDPADLPPVHVRRGDRWTKPKMVEFLRQLAATHSVSEAARRVGMHRRSAYKLRARLKGQPFDIAWEAAFRHGYDNLAHAALDRAINGVEVPHYNNGELVGTSRKYDERLTVALLAMRNRAGAPMLGRYGAAAEYWGDRWDMLLQRVETGAVDWSDERRALGEAKLLECDLPDEEREVQRLIARNAPDLPPEKAGGR